MRIEGKQNVLVTGATTVIGRQTVEQLYYDDERFHHVVAVGLDRQRPYYFEEYDQKRFAYVSVNILKERELTNFFLSDAFRSAEVDSVIHLAYMHRSHGSAERHVLNVEGTQALLDKCLATDGIRTFVSLSSWDVYKLRPHNPVLLDENSEINFEQGADPWIKDRVDVDMLCRARMDHPRAQVIVLRSTGIIGRNVPSQIMQYLESAVCPRVAGYDPMLNLVHTSDVIRAIRCAVLSGVKGVYNVVGQDTAPLSEFIRLAGRRSVELPEPGVAALNRLQRALGLTKWDFRVRPSRLKYSCVLDGSKAARVLGYHPARHVKFGA